MVSEYYVLVSSYVEQDKVMLISLCFAGLVWLGWLSIQRFKLPWLNFFYISELVAIWIGILILFSPAAALLTH